MFPLLTTFALANDSNWSVGYLVSGSFDQDPGGSADINSITLSYNQSVSDNLTLEYEFGFGVGDDDIDFDAGYGCIFSSCEVSLNHHIGIYASYNFINEGAFKPYVKLGISQASFDFGPTDDSGNDLSYGLGATIATSFQIEYMNYYDKDGVSIDGITLNYLF